MTAETAHLGRWRQQLGAPGRRPVVQRRYERTVAALEREGNHAAPVPAGGARPRGREGRPVSARAARRGGGPRVLFATSNGTGLGHLNRAMAIARRLPPGHRVVVLHALGAPPRSSRRRAGTSITSPPTGAPAPAPTAPGTSDSARCSSRSSPSASPTSSSSTASIPTGRSPTCSAPAARRRRSGAGGRCGGPAARRRRSAASAPSTRSSSPASSPRRTTAGRRSPRRREATPGPPDRLLDRDELLPRGRPPRELGLDPARRTALVTLGQGGEVDRAVARTLEALTRGPGAPGRGAAARASRPALEVPDGVVQLERDLPDEPLLRAFDVAVAAAGYNAFHELIALRGPDPVRADGAQHRRPGGARALGGRCGGGAGRRAGPATRRSRSGSPSSPTPIAPRRSRPAASASCPATAPAMPPISSPRCSPATVPRPPSATAAASTAGCGSRATGSARRCRSSPRSAPAISLRHPERRRAVSRRPRDGRPRWRAGSSGSARRSASCRRSASSSSPTRRVRASCGRLGVGFELLPPARRRRRGGITSVATCAPASASCSRGRRPLRARLDRRPRRRAARLGAGPTRPAAMTDRAPGILGGAYGGSGPD